MAKDACDSWKGTVREIVRGPAGTEVTLQLPGGLRIQSNLSAESLETINLEEGQEAFAVIADGKITLRDRRPAALKLRPDADADADDAPRPGAGPEPRAGRATSKANRG